MNKQIEFIIFWITIIIVILFSFISYKIKKKEQKIIVFLFMAVFCFLYSYRTLGMDIKNYIQSYDYFTVDHLLRRLELPSLFSYEYEPLYFLILFISKNMLFTFQQCQLIFYSISSLIFFYFICKKTNYPLIAYFLFMIEMMFHFDLTRFFIAASFICIGFYCNKKFFKYFFYFIAFCFHYSSIFFLILELLTKLFAKLKNKKLILIFYMLIFIFFILLKFVDLSFLSNSNFKLLFKFQYYMTNKNSSFSDIPVMRFLYILINVYPIYMSYKLVKLLNKVDILDKHRNMISTISSITQNGIFLSLLFLLFFQNYQLAFRVVLLSYFMIFIPLSDIVGNGLKNGKISKNALKIIFNLFFFDILMSAYYIGISIVY